MALRQWYVDRALESYASLTEVINDLTEPEVMAALDLEDATQRRRTIVERLMQRAVRLRTLAASKDLKERYGTS
jgi:hypothetical protein